MSRYDKLKNVSKRVSATNTQQTDTNGTENHSKDKMDRVEKAHNNLVEHWKNRSAFAKYPKGNWREGTTASEIHNNQNRITQVASQKKWSKEAAAERQDRRPHSRKRTDSGKTGTVKVKADEKLGKKKPSNR